MRDPRVGGQQVAVEDAACVGAGEVAGFGGRVEDLWECVRVDGEVVDGFVARDAAGVVGCFGEHAGDGAGVGEFELLALLCAKKEGCCVSDDVFFGRMRECFFLVRRVLGEMSENG